MLTNLTTYIINGPLFLFLTDIVTSITGLSLTTIEFLLFTVIGIVISSSLFVYLSVKFKNNASFAVVAFFASMLLFFNYQDVPFSLGLCIFFLMLTLDFQKKTVSLMVTYMVLYVSLLLTHSFVPLFFVIYLFVRMIYDRSNYLGLFIFSLITYFVMELNFARYSLEQVLNTIWNAPQEYSYIASQTFVPVTIPLDVTAQLFSRTVTVSFILLCVIGFIFLLIKRRLTVVDKAVFITGAVYTFLGAVINTLGWRAIAIAFIPISGGVAYLFESKFRKYLKSIFLILLILFVFIPLHQSFTPEVQIQFQAKSQYVAENFFIDHYNWEKSTNILTGFRAATYLTPKSSFYPNIVTDFEQINQAEVIIYTTELGQVFLENNVTIDDVVKPQGLNVVYTNGLSSIVIRVSG